MADTAKLHLQRPLDPQPRQDATGPATSALRADLAAGQLLADEANRAGTFGFGGSQAVALEPVDEGSSVAR